MVRINGEDQLAEGVKLSDWLNANVYALERVAVERNGEIVPKGAYGKTLLQSGDVLEVVRFVGGRLKMSMRKGRGT